jgi:hypothetical protein
LLGKLLYLFSFVHISLPWSSTIFQSIKFQILKSFIHAALIQNCGDSKETKCAIVAEAGVYSFGVTLDSVWCEIKVVEDLLFLELIVNYIGIYFVWMYLFKLVQIFDFVRCEALSYNLLFCYIDSRVILLD